MPWCLVVPVQHLAWYWLYEYSMSLRFLRTILTSFCLNCKVIWFNADKCIYFYKTIHDCIINVDFMHGPKIIFFMDKTALQLQMPWCHMTTGHQLPHWLHDLTLSVLKPEYSRTCSIPWLLMPGLLASPDHHQQLYWLYRINRISIFCLIWVLRIKKIRDIFIFPEIDLAWQVSIKK